MKRANIIDVLRAEINQLQGFKPFGCTDLDMGLGPVNAAFPNQSFPLSAVHEFLAGHPFENAVTSGFVSGLLSGIMGSNGVGLWISASGSLFPPALKAFGVDPDRIIFLDLQKEKDVIWATEEALKCGALSTVVAELDEIGFTASRRLQLAVEHSGVTGFVIRRNCRKVNTTACVSRWRITSLPSNPIDDLPGVGFPKWRVELLRIRNGKPGAWDIHWIKGKFKVALADEAGDITWSAAQSAG